MNEKPYEFRKLGAVDVSPMCKIIGKIGIDKFATCFQSDAVKALMAKSKKNIDVVGIQVILDIANIIIVAVPVCEADVFAFLASVSNLTVDEIKAFDLPTFTEMIVDFVKKEEFKDFIGVVSKLFE